MNYKFINIFLILICDFDINNVNDQYCNEDLCDGCNCIFEENQVNNYCIDCIDIGLNWICNI